MRKMSRTALILLVAAVAALVVDAQFNNQLFLVTNNLCLTLGADQQTVQLFTCGQYGYQQFDLSSGERIQLGGYCLDAYPGPSGALQMKPCSYQTSQSWWFNRDGRIMNKANPNGCLASMGSVGSTLYLANCAQTTSLFYSSTTAATMTAAVPQPSLPGFGLMPQQPQAMPPPQLPPMQPQYAAAPQYMAPPPPPQMPQPQYAAPQLPPMLPQQQPAPMQQQSYMPPLSPPPQLPSQQQQQQQAPPPAQSPPPPLGMSQQIQQQTFQVPPVQQQQPQVAKPAANLENDHFLCTCIVDASAEACNEAVRAACAIGHLDSHACRQSFSAGNHDKIADDILKLIEHGAKCSRFDINQLRKEAQKHPADLPVNTLSHSIDGVPTSEDHYLCVCLDSASSDKCIAAVKAACLVGHIPAGDCQASMSRGDHDGATDHILKLIDNGAACSKGLPQKRTPPPTKKAGFVSRMFHSSPKTVGADEKDLCTCLDDPESALCGMAIKRACDAKRIPLEDCQAAKSKHYMGGVTKHALRLIDHGADCPAHRSMTFTNHGCHCLQSWRENGQTLTFPNNCADPGGKKGYAWCKTFKSEHCAGVEGSTEWDRCDNPKFPIRRDPAIVDGTGVSADGKLGAEDHYLCICLSTTSTDEVCVAAVKAACEVGHLPSEACRSSFENDQHQQVSDMVVQLLQGGAKCTETLGEQGIVRAKAGETQCPDGYYGFPNCRPKVECEQKCSHGATCDYSDGTCQCMPNFVGPTCSQCAEGYSGRNCLPDGAGDGWTLGQGLVYLFLFAGLIYAGFTAYKRFGGELAQRGITYTRVPTAMESGDVPEGFPSNVDDAISMSSDLGGDIEEQRGPGPQESGETKPKKQEHNGLAI